MDLDENNDVMPDMATSWEISEDNRSLTFTLADGIRWHDGTLLTREDMEFTFCPLTEKSQLVRQPIRRAGGVSG